MEENPKKPVRLLAKKGKNLKELKLTQFRIKVAGYRIAVFFDSGFQNLSIGSNGNEPFFRKK
ncbi:hypothetical protein J0895_06940, partial [Phormidium pseudopriestleyi FRX01]